MQCMAPAQAVAHSSSEAQMWDAEAPQRRLGQAVEMTQTPPPRLPWETGPLGEIFAPELHVQGRPPVHTRGELQASMQDVRGLRPALRTVTWSDICNDLRGVVLRQWRFIVDLGLGSSRLGRLLAARDEDSQEAAQAVRDALYPRWPPH